MEVEVGGLPPGPAKNTGLLGAAVLLDRFPQRGPAREVKPMIGSAPMGEMITNPEVNPMWIGGLNLIGLGGIGYYLLGQRKKAFITWAVVLIGGFCTFGLSSMLIPLAAYDGYLLAQRMAHGEAIRDTENSFPFLDVIFR